MSLSSVLSNLVECIYRYASQKRKLKDAIRIDGWHSSGSDAPSILLSNYGDNLIVRDIVDCDKGAFIIDRKEVQRWLPIYFDKGKLLRVPLLRRVMNCPTNSRFQIVLEGECGRFWACEVLINGAGCKPVVIGKIKHKCCLYKNKKQ